MSLLDILDLEAPRQLVPKERTRERPYIEVVPDTGVERPAPSRAPFVLLVLAILGIGLVGLLMLNTSLQQGAFLIHDLERGTTKLNERAAVLEQKVAGLQAPEALADRAKALGMVPNDRPGFIDPNRGGVSGNPKPADAPVPNQRSEPETKPKASEGATSQPDTGRANE